MYNILIQGFVASDTRTVAYLKQNEKTREYAVKVMHRDGTKTFVVYTYSLSAALRELAETVAQYTNDFTTWRVL